MSALDYFKDWRILIVVVAIVLLLIADAIHGLNFGVEFVGGTQIPITLAAPVTPLQMSTITQILDQRLTKFGVSEVTVEPVGNSGLYVTIPSTSGTSINNTISIIKQQGIFQGIVNGREAINGSGILDGSITPLTPVVSGLNVTWEVTFTITPQAQDKFAKAVFGQANKPLYMFLDRPTSSIVLFNQSLLGTAPLGSTLQTEISIMQSSLSFRNQTIPLELINSNSSNWNALYPFFKSNELKYRTVIVQAGTPNFIISNLTALNYSVQFETIANMTPTFQPTNTSIVMNTWPAVGLLSAPNLEASLTTGNLNGSTEYDITGSELNGTLQQRINSANNESNRISTVLSGGALPVQVLVGQPITTPATLGKSFELVSAVALLLAIVAVGVTIVIRYKKLFLIAPILLTTLAELFIIGSIMGLVATIDLSAIAGMIAVIGTGVDAQIIITDEILAGHKESTMRTRMGHAFYLIMRNALLLSLAMLPLFFSALTTEIWFAGATIIGALLGAAITRPAYGAIVSRRYNTQQQV